MTRTANHFLRLVRQRGSATLVVSLVLLGAMSLVSLFTARSTLMEHRVSINDYKAKQLSEAAVAGLENGLRWINSNANTLTFTADATQAGFNVRATNPPATLTLANGYTAALAIYMHSSNPRRLLLISSASPPDGSGATAVSRTLAYMRTAMNGSPGAGFVVNGCLSGVTGNPDLENVDNPGGPGIISSQNAGCIDPGSLDMHGSTVEGETFAPAPDAAWSRTFGMTKAEFQTMAAADEAADPSPGTYTDRTYIYVTSPSNWHSDVGSLGPPVRSAILVFAPSAGCPKLNGGPVIVGVVYYEGPCSAQGWGGATIYGSVVMDGDITKMTSNSFTHYSDVYTSSFANTYLGLQSRMPGSWIDQ